MLNIDADTVFDLKVTGADLVNILIGLGEIQHKLAGPTEKKLIDQVIAARDRTKKGK